MKYLTRRNFVRAVGAGTVAGTLFAGTAAGKNTWTAQLEPAGEGTSARGNAEFKYVEQRPGGFERMEFGIQISNLEGEVFAAHIHHDAGHDHGGTFGPILVWLIPTAMEKEIVRGNFYAADGQFEDGDLVGAEDVTSLEDLVSEINAGKTTVRVHTGEFPTGEVVGTIG